MAKTFQLEILTPFGKYLSQEVEFLEVKSQEYLLGILPGHTPLITTVAISKLTTKSFGETYIYAVGGGVLHIEKDKTLLLLDSIERKDEIDIDRAYSAKKRAEDRLSNKSIMTDNDILLAEASLKRALMRINVFENN